MDKFSNIIDESVDEPTYEHTRSKLEQGHTGIVRTQESTGVMAQWDSGNTQVRTSFDPTTQHGRAMVSQGLEEAELKTRNACGQVWEITDYIAHPVQLTDEETGEIRWVMRLVLWTRDGRRISSCSGPVVKAFAWLSSQYGRGPWEPPIQIRFREVQGRMGHSYCTIAEIERETPAVERGSGKESKSKK